MFILFTIIYVLLLCNPCLSNILFDYTLNNSDIKWLEILDGSLTDIIENGICRSQIYGYNNALKDLELWAVHMFDSSTKLHTGVLSGHTVDYGGFEQCLRVRNRKAQYGMIEGKHCTVSMDVVPKDYFAMMLKLMYKPQNIQLGKYDNLGYDDTFVNKTIDGDDRLSKTIQLVFGICLPASCTGNDARNFINIFYGHMNLSVRRSYDPELYCYKDESRRFTLRDNICLCFFCFVATLMTLSTGYDLVMEFVYKGTARTFPIFLIFSMWTNGKRILDTSSADISDRKIIPCLYGIRGLSTISIFVYYKLQMHGYIQNSFMGFLHPIDTFFLLSGLLLYHSVDVFKSINVWTVLRVYLHRYLRVTPALAAIVFFKMTLLLHVGIGPLWRVATYTGNCDSFWWSSLLHIQNYINPIFECIPNSWYVSADMQMLLLSPLVIIPLKKWRKWGLSATLGLIVIALGIRIILQGLNSDGRFDVTLYYATHARFGPFLLGILLGYAIKEGPETLNPVAHAVCWGVSLTIIIYIQFFMTFFAPFTRILWSTSIGWIIYSCHKGYGGPINEILSRPFWQPVSRLSYCMYLIYYPLQEMITGSQKHAEYLNFFLILYYIWGELAAIVILAMVWSMAFEIPILNMEKLCYQTKLKPKNKKADLFELDAKDLIEVKT